MTPSLLPSLNGLSPQCPPPGGRSLQSMVEAGLTSPWRYRCRLREPDGVTSTRLHITDPHLSVSPGHRSNKVTTTTTFAELHWRHSLKCEYECVNLCALHQQRGVGWRPISTLCPTPRWAETPQVGTAITCQLYFQVPSQTLLPGCIITASSV